ncbi:hypothetical protein C6502_15765 [Candidatus Poribacteria bacterium]|nr:MAG: hypothetical protein C6502_15765 [Candidatus Poribacteria bacterium]
MKQVDILFTIVLLLIAISIVPLESAGQGTTAAPILNLGGGTRAAALGDAFSAINNDVTAALWNPSGLGIMDRRQVALSYVDRAQLFGEAGEGLYYAFFAGALPFGDVGTLGTMLQLEGQGEIDVTTTSPEPIRTENLGTNWVWTVSYADKLAKGLLGGVSGKVISLKLGEASARAYAIDFGLQYDLPSILVPIRVGAAVQNWGTRIHFIDENQSDPLPRLFRFGTAIILFNQGNNQIRLIGDLTASIDQLRKDEDELRLELSAQLSNELGPMDDQEQETEFTSEQLADARSERGIGVHALEWRHMQKSIGLEYWLGNFLALRVGYKEEPGINLLNFSDHLTYGLGVKLLNYQLDFAQLPGGGPEQKRLNVFALILQF